MKSHPTRFVHKILRAAAWLAAAAGAPVLAQTPPEQVIINAPYVQTPDELVVEMLKLARVNHHDTVYDLGCGDGRIVIEAARRCHARGFGVDINAEHVKEALQRAGAAGVSNRVRFEQGDLFDIDLSPATVVTLYLFPEQNAKLQPKLLRELKPGSRVVSHAFKIGTWKPDKTIQVNGAMLYYWVVPKKTSS